MLSLYYCVKKENMDRLYNVIITITITYVK